MLRKKDSFTIITPIPGFIPRQLAIDILHSHSEVITLNPLVLEHKPIAAPQNAETDEYYSTWYEITERVTFVPGIGRMGASIIKFNGCFHDMPWGLQTHIYAPMNVDLRNKYRIAGNQPGIEPPAVQEIGLKSLGVPADGLYLREDIEIKCNVTVLSFVKSQLKKAGGEMVARIIKKAELLDAGVLQAMIEDGKLKTVNPADRRNTARRSPLPSPGLQYSPSIPGTPPPNSPQIPYQIPRPQSGTQGVHAYRPSTAGSQPPSSHHSQPAAFGYGTPGGPVEMPVTEPASDNNFVAEMPGDYYHTSSDLQQPPRSNNSPRASPRPAYGQQLHPNRDSATYSDKTHQSQNGTPDPGHNGTWSSNSRPNSTSSAASLGVAGAGLYSPGLDSKGFHNNASRLQTHEEESPQEQHRDEALRRLDPRIPHPSHYPPYNPADYAKVDPRKQQQQSAAYPGQPQYGRGQVTQRYNYTQ